MIVESADRVGAVEAVVPRVEMVEQETVDVHKPVQPVLVRVQDEGGHNELQIAHIQ